jgi:hypothetical protein
MTRGSADKRLARVFRALIAVDVLIVSIYVLDHALDIVPHPYKRLVDIDAELSVAAWFSSIQLFALGVSFALIRGSRVTGGIRRLMFVLAILAVFLSMDEMLALHEQLSMSFRRTEWMPTFKGGHGAWVYVYGVIALLLGVWLLRDFLEMYDTYPRSSRIILAGAFVSWTGAVGVEIIGYEWLREDRGSALYEASVILEELMELAGCSVALYGAMLLLSSRIDVGVRPR